jgi:hypothetical protein
VSCGVMRWRYERANAVVSRSAASTRPPKPRPVPQEVARNDYKNFRINRRGSVQGNKWTKEHCILA